MLWSLGQKEQLGESVHFCGRAPIQGRRAFLRPALSERQIKRPLTPTVAPIVVVTTPCERGDRAPGRTGPSSSPAVIALRAQDVAERRPEKHAVVAILMPLPSYYG